jgi:hypothetical protein
MTRSQFGLIVIASGVVLALLTPYLAPSQVNLLNLFGRLRLGESAIRTMTIAFFAVAATLAILGISLVITA